jgi:hypothetical protein
MNYFVVTLKEDGKTFSVNEKYEISREQPGSLCINRSAKLREIKEDNSMEEM